MAAIIIIPSIRYHHHHSQHHKQEHHANHYQLSYTTLTSLPIRWTHFTTELESNCHKLTHKKHELDKIVFFGIASLDLAIARRYQHKQERKLANQLRRSLFTTHLHFTYYQILPPFLPCKKFTYASNSDHIKGITSATLGVTVATGISLYVKSSVGVSVLSQFS